MGGFGGIKRFDLYAKVPVDLTNPTTTGSIISIVAALTMIYLFVSESVSVLQWEEKVNLIVEPDHGGRLRANFNMTFPRFPCFAFSLDIVDAMGRHEIGLSTTLRKTRLSHEGAELGIFTDLPGEDELRQQAHEGCNVVGYVAVNKVPGNFHVSAHTSAHLVHQFLGGHINLNHEIHSLWVGDKYLTPKQFPGHLHPLDGTVHLTESAGTVYEYFLDIIPTIYKRGREQNKGYQIVAHRQANPSGQQMPAIYFRYTLSPLQVVYDSQRKSLSHFIVRRTAAHLYRGVYLCAIVGGVFTVMGIVNELLLGSIRVVQKNILGKAD